MTDWSVPPVETFHHFDSPVAACICLEGRAGEVAGRVDRQIWGRAFFELCRRPGLDDCAPYDSTRRRIQELTAHFLAASVAD